MLMMSLDVLEGPSVTIDCFHDLTNLLSLTDPDFGYHSAIKHHPTDT